MHARHDFDWPENRPPLTLRQLQVLELVAKRRALKQIAADLRISESAVNQHVRALKAALSANSLPDLAEIYQNRDGDVLQEAYRKTACRNSGLLGSAMTEQFQQRDEIEPVAIFHEPLSYRMSAPWEVNDEHEIVPGVLNGTNAVWIRAAIIVALTIGVFTAVIVGLGAAEGVSKILSASGSAL